MLKWTPSMDPPLLAEIEMSPDLQRDNIQEALRALKESDCSQVAKHLLTSFIQHMKFGAGQSRVVLQVISRANSCDELEEFGRWLRAFLNHLRSVGGQTPDISTPHTVDDEIARTKIVAKLSPRSRNDLKRQALVRDGGRCVISTIQDPRNAVGSELCEDTQCSHILPSSLANFDQDEVEDISHFFYAFQWLFPEVGDFGPDQINDIRNVITLSCGVHRDFGALRLALSPVRGTKDVYQLIRYNPHNRVPLVYAPTDGRIQMINHSTEPNIPMPDSTLLQIHFVCCAAWNSDPAMEKTYLAFEDFRSLPQLAPDGSTVIPSLL